ncbi:unnamed protein product [Owenia fusiformis]|uniref:Reticulon-like protein n=1 Tax=Owenia fusiformis TaxID=6347 RepID=A0A8J1XWF1_OWEFU|nr:unnamed protein product [Owenia fusiformis]
MEEFNPESTQSSQPESNDFDFEKLDPLVGDPAVTSSTREEAEEDLYTGPPPSAPVPEPEPSKPLVTFDDEPVQVSPTPDSTKEATPEKSDGSGGLAARLQTLDPRVKDLIYWRDVKKSGVVFGSVFILLLSLSLFSVLSVFAYLSLAILTVTISFRVYKQILQAVQKTGDGHPFKQFLEAEVEIPSDKAHHVADHIVEHINRDIVRLRRLFLVEDIVDSIKFGLLLWVLTYIGGWFNGMTLIILGWVAIFTLPKVYEQYQGPIDQYVDLIKTNVNNVISQVQAKIPIGKKKTQ